MNTITVYSDLLAFALGTAMFIGVALGYQVGKVLTANRMKRRVAEAVTKSFKKAVEMSDKAQGAEIPKAPLGSRVAGQVLTRPECTCGAKSVAVHEATCPSRSAMRVVK